MIGVSPTAEAAERSGHVRRAVTAASLITIPLWAALSDDIGRRRMIRFGNVAMLGFAFAYFGLLDTHTPALIGLVIAISLPIHDMQHGPQAAFIAETFTPRLRYSGASLGYQLASLTAGGPAPLIAVWLYDHGHESLPVAIYLMVATLIGIAATLMLPDRSRTALDQKFA